MSNITLTIKRNTPLIQTCDDFLSHDECRLLINDDLNQESVYNKISNILNIDRSRLENIELIKYDLTNTCERQSDFFTGTNSIEQCRYGGNRVGTVILFLNKVNSGGETYLPWLRMYETPVEGKLLYLNYDYEDINIKIKTEYQHMPVKEGEKWIAVIRIREFPLTHYVENPVPLLDFYSQPFEDTVFELTCGPVDDLRTLRVELPANDTPGNAILVGVTGGMDSSLLLYILGKINNLQKIPYFIQPIAIHNLNGSSDVPGNKYARPLTEDWLIIKKMITYIRKNANGYILNHTLKPAPENFNLRKQRNEGMSMFFKSQYKDTYPLFKFVKYKYIYVGTTENPPNDEVPNGPDRIVDVPSHWKNPFIHIQKTHIVDAIIQLNLLEIFEITSKCTIHKTLDEVCTNMWQCNERRWAFRRLGRRELGTHYFINFEESNIFHTGINMDSSTFDRITSSQLLDNNDSVGTFITIPKLNI